ncbi:hypothetical protein B0H11DRAFT_1936719 [Mycena galericulata]|nr:hypothetical protein B0H11DRAFT_1936719 [Mycena galericulata]
MSSRNFANFGPKLGANDRKITCFYSNFTFRTLGAKFFKPQLELPLLGGLNISGGNSSVLSVHLGSKLGYRSCCAVVVDIKIWMCSSEEATDGYQWAHVKCFLENQLPMLELAVASLVEIILAPAPEILNGIELWVKLGEEMTLVARLLDNLRPICGATVNLHYFETVEAFPQILLLHQTVAEAGIQPDSHIYVRFPLLGGAGSRDNPDPRLIVKGRRQRKQAPTLSDPNNGETENGDAASTFNRRMDVLFGEDLRDAGGRLKYVATGKHGMGAVVKYLKTVPWAELQCHIARPKLDRLILLTLLILIDFMFASSNSSASSKPNSKRKSSEPTSDAEDPPDTKRIRSMHEVPDENNLDFQPEVEDDHISVHDSSGEESDATQHQSRSRSKARKKETETGASASDMQPGDSAALYLALGSPAVPPDMTHFWALSIPTTLQALL